MWSRAVSRSSRYLSRSVNSSSFLKLGEDWKSAGSIEDGRGSSDGMQMSAFVMDLFNSCSLKI